MDRRSRLGPDGRLSLNSSFVGTVVVGLSTAISSAAWVGMLEAGPVLLLEGVWGAVPVAIVVAGARKEGGNSRRIGDLEPGVSFERRLGRFTRVGIVRRCTRKLRLKDGLVTASQFRLKARQTVGRLLLDSS